MNDRSERSCGHLAAKVGEPASTQLPGEGCGQDGIHLAGGS